MAGEERMDENFGTGEIEESTAPPSLLSQNEDEETSDQPSTLTESHDKLTQLPLSRIKNIIKTDPDVKMTSQDAVIVLAKAAELFIHQLVSDTVVKTVSERKKTLTRQHLGGVDEKETMNMNNR